MIRHDDHGAYLSKWIDSAIDTRSWERNDDLHIDEVDSTIIASKDFWVDFSLDLYRQLLEILPNGYKAYLVIRLSCTDKATDINTLSFDNIKKELDFTPPSFYLFPVNNEIYNNVIKKMSFVKHLSINIGMDVYFSEYLEETDNADEYYRYLDIRG